MPSARPVRRPERAPGHRWRTRELTTSRAARVAVAALALVVAVTGLTLGLPGTSEADNNSCSAGTSVTVVAHPDDDLFFFNPRIVRDVEAGRCVTTVFATSGDGGDGGSYASEREAGIRAAYATMGGVANSWTSARQLFNGHSLERLTLTAQPRISVVFMRLPDGNIDGSGTQRSGGTSLRKLYSGTIASLTSYDSPAQTFTRADLVATFGAMFTQLGATLVRTMDNEHAFDTGDHSDHIAVARLVTEARSAFAPALPLQSYLGYPSVYLPANVTGEDLTDKVAAFESYAPNDRNMCATYAACQAAGRSDALWLQRVRLASELDNGPSADPDAAGNAALSAVVTASSQNAGTGQTAAKAADGVVDGWPGDYTSEWATDGGGTGSWVQLNWGDPLRIGSVTLFDRPNASDNITSATLTFSDGSTVAVGALPTDGTARTVTFPDEVTSSIRLTVIGVGPDTHNVGLAEFQAWTADSPTPTTPTPTPTTSSAPTTSAAPTSGPAPADTNLASSASATASSQNTGTGQLASRAVDGVIDGYPGNYTAEWATSGGGSGSWLQLTWPSPVTVDSVVLFDRPNLSDQVTGGTLTFSDGSTVAVPSLTDTGAAVTVAVPSRTTTSIRLTVTSVSSTTKNVGLAEFQVWRRGATTPTTSATASSSAPTSAPTTATTSPTTATTSPTTTTAAPTTTTAAPTTSTAPTSPASGPTVTASSENAATGQTAVKAVDGVVDGYPGNYTAEWATTGGGAGSWLQLTYGSARTFTAVTLHDRPNTSDRITGATLTFSDGSTVTVPALADDGSATTVSFPARTSSWVRITVTSVSSTTENVGLAEVTVA